MLFLLLANFKLSKGLTICAFVLTATSKYCSVGLILLCPKSSCIYRISTAFSSKCVANECRSTWGVLCFVISARFDVASTTRSKLRVPYLLINNFPVHKIANSFNLNNQHFSLIRYVVRIKVAQFTRLR